MIRRACRLLGDPRALLVCAAALLLSRATIGLTGATPTPLAVGSHDIQLRRYTGSSWPQRTITTVLFTLNERGEYAVVEVKDTTQTEYFVWNTHAKRPLFLTLARSSERKGAWAPVEQRVSYDTCLNGDLPAGSTYAETFTAAMKAMPRDIRADWPALFPAGRAFRGSIERTEVLHWGYAWNVTTLGAILGVAAWPFFAPLWFLQRRADRRRARCQCVRCAYQLATDTVTLGTCPECGAKSAA